MENEAFVEEADRVQRLPAQKQDGADSEDRSLVEPG
jgi:hypothetical protein